MWTTDYEADIASDLSAFHRIDDPMAIDGPRYFSLAIRLAAYAGVLAARMEKLRQDERDGGSAVQQHAASTPARVSDDVLIASLSDGWVEHIVEERA